MKLRFLRACYLGILFFSEGQLFFLPMHCASFHPATRAGAGQASRWLRPTGTVCGIRGCHCTVQGNFLRQLRSQLGCTPELGAGVRGEGGPWNVKKGKGTSSARARATHSLTALSWAALFSCLTSFNSRLGSLLVLLHPKPFLVALPSFTKPTLNNHLGSGCEVFPAQS